MAQIVLSLTGRSQAPGVVGPLLHGIAQKIYRLIYTHNLLFLGRPGQSQSAATAPALTGAVTMGFLGNRSQGNLALLCQAFTVSEQIHEALVEALDDCEEFIDPQGFARYVVCGRIRDYRIAELRGTANTLGGQQGKHCLRIMVLRLALLPFLNGPGRFAHVIHGIPELAEDARLDWAVAHVILEIN